MKLFGFGRKKTAEKDTLLEQNNSELLDASVSDEKIVKLFEGYENLYNLYGVSSALKTQIRKVKCGDEVFYACCYSTANRYNYGYRDEIDHADQALNLVVLSDKTKQAQVFSYENHKDGGTLPVLDINAGIKTVKKDVAEALGKFFLITPEERQSYQSGTKHPTMYEVVKNIVSYANSKKNRFDFSEHEWIQKPGYTPHYYAKSARISARPGKVGEKIKTIMEDGYREGKNTVKNEGDMVATNPGGEQYIIDAKTFAKKYEIDPDNPSQYRPKGGAQELIEVGENIAFKAPWGEEMMLKKGGMLNITGMDNSDVYGIQRKEFEETYAPCGKDGKFTRQSLRKMLKHATSKAEQHHLATQLSQNNDQERVKQAEELRKQRKTRDEYNATRQKMVAERKAQH